MTAPRPITHDAPPLGGPAIASQRWSDLTFLHWRVPAADVAPLLPAGVEPDEFDGNNRESEVHVHQRRQDVWPVGIPRRLAGTPGSQNLTFKLTLVAVALTATATLTSCSAEAPPGPLGFGGDSVSQCLPAITGDVLLIGDVLTAPAGVDATILEVSLIDARGVSVQASYLMEIVGGEAIGSATMPPEDPPNAWERRDDAVGGVIPSGSERNLLLAVERTGSDDGSIGAVQIDYEVDGVEYRKAGTIAYRFADTC